MDALSRPLTRRGCSCVQLWPASWVTQSIGLEQPRAAPQQAWVANPVRAETKSTELALSPGSSRVQIRPASVVSKSRFEIDPGTLRFSCSSVTERHQCGGGAARQPDYLGVHAQLGRVPAQAREAVRDPRQTGEAGWANFGEGEPILE